MTVTDPRRQVLDTALTMYRRGLVEGTAGNVSARLPDGTVCMTPSSTPYEAITVESLPIVDVEGNQMGGEGRPTSERSLHLACYRDHPEVGGVVHCHPTYASMFAVARQPIPAVIEEVVVYVGGDVPVCEYHTTGTDELGDEVARNLGDRSAALMANHGLVCVGASPDDALHNALVVERTAHIVWGARALGPVGEIPEAVDASFADVYRYLRSTWSP